MYVQLALQEYFFHLFLGERDFTAQPESEESDTFAAIRLY